MFELVKRNSTHFSEQIRNESEHLDEVTVAGLIKSIIPPTSDYQNDLSSHYIVELDDTVGTIYIYISPLMKNYASCIEKGNIVALKGFVNILHREINGKVDRNFSIAAFEAKELRLKDTSNA